MGQRESTSFQSSEALTRGAGAFAVDCKLWPQAPPGPAPRSIAGLCQGLCRGQALSLLPGRLPDDVSCQLPSAVLGAPSGPHTEVDPDYLPPSGTHPEVRPGHSVSRSATPCLVLGDAPLLAGWCWVGPLDISSLSPASAQPLPWPHLASHVGVCPDCPEVCKAARALCPVSPAL